MRMDWSKLLSASRLGRGVTAGDVRTSFQRDYDRIVFCSAFRRLQDKTQVFPLAESDYIRTRLTHSIEVSCVGRSLGTLVGSRILEKEKVKGRNAQEFGEIVAAACLAHDIGNPPFGHSGEEAIRTWFKGQGRKYLKGLTKLQCNDFLKFEGNAQGFRVIAHLQNNVGSGGLQLTHAVLGTFAKYPRRSHVSGIMTSEKISEKKFGYVAADERWFREVADSLKLIQRRPGAWARHPLAFLMEAADDICYRIIDLEDGYRLRRVTFAEAESLLLPIAARTTEELSKSGYGEIEEEKRRVEYLRARAIGALIYAAVDVFDLRYEEIMHGQFDESLLRVSVFAKELRAIEKVSKQVVYSAPHVIQIETAGFEVLGGLLDKVVPCLVGQSKRTSADKKFLQLIPLQFTQGKDRYERLLNATDFVSGMTDTYAVTLYRRILGIELPRSL